MKGGSKWELEELEFEGILWVLKSSKADFVPVNSGAFVWL